MVSVNAGEAIIYKEEVGVLGQRVDTTLKLPVTSEVNILRPRGHVQPPSFQNAAFVLFFRIKIRRLLSCFYFSNMSIVFNDSLLFSAVGNPNCKNIVYFPMGLN